MKVFFEGPCRQAVRRAGAVEVARRPEVPRRGAESLLFSTNGSTGRRRCSVTDTMQKPSKPCVAYYCSCVRHTESCESCVRHTDTMWKPSKTNHVVDVTTCFILRHRWCFHLSSNNNMPHTRLMAHGCVRPGTEASDHILPTILVSFFSIIAP